MWLARRSLQRSASKRLQRGSHALHFMNRTAPFMNHAAPFVNIGLPLERSPCTTAP